MRQTIKWLFRIVFLIFGIIILFLVAYFFGHRLLTGGLIGNDTPNSFSFISWLDAQYPRIPLWYPLQGAGVSFVQGYQVAPHLLVVYIHRFSSLSLMQSFELLSFLSVFLSAVGVYMVGWYLTKKQMVAFLAGFFYLLSPLSWVWIAQAGFFAQSLSFVFFPFAFLVIDRFISSIRNKEGLKKIYLFFLMAIICIGFSLLGHFSTYMSLFNLFFLYASILFFQGLFVKDKTVFPAFFLGLPAVFISGVLIVAFWFFSLYHYISAANWDGSNNVDPLSFPSIDGHAFLSFPSPTYASISVWNLSIPLWMWILGIISIIFAFKNHKKIFALGVVFLISLYGSISYEIFIISAKVSAFFASGFSPRVFWVVAQFLAPLLAAISLWLIVEWIFSFIKKIDLSLGKVIFWFIPITVLFLACVVVWIGRSPDIGISSFAHYGPIYFYPRMGANTHDPSIQGGLDLRDIWQKSYNSCSTSDLGGAKNGCFLVSNNAMECAYNLKRKDAIFCEQHGYTASIGQFFFQLKPDNWPPFILGNDPITQRIANVNEISVDIPRKDQLTRIDISPHLGTAVEAFDILRHDLSMVNVYTFQLSLIHDFWAMEQGAFYSAKDDGINATVNFNREMGKWFGTNYVVLGIGDPINRFLKAGIWDIYKKTKNYTIMKLKKQLNLAEVSNKPKVLVIGQWNKRVYEEAFRLAVNGMLPEDKGLLVMGKNSIENYSGSELSKFPLIILQGYTYSNQQNAWNKLGTYVKNGGHLYIDTGWQYVTPDFTLSQTPDFFPTTFLSWTNLPINDNYIVNDKNLLSEKTVSNFSPLVYEGGSWGVSTSQSIREGVTPILSYDGYPLVAKKIYGRGVVIWSGMNLFAHALDKRNPSEIIFVSKLISSLLPSKKPLIYPINFSIPSVDLRKIVFLNNIPSGSLLLREAYIKNWKAELINKQGNISLPIYRAGPGLMVVPLIQIKKGDSIIFSYQLSWFEYLGIIITVVFVLGLLIFSFDLYFNKLHFTKSLFSFKKNINVLKFNYRDILKRIIGDEDD